MLKYKQIWYGIKPIRWLNKFNLTRVTRGFKPPDTAYVPSMLEGKQSCKLEHYRTKQDNWPYGYLATGSRDLVKPRATPVL